MVLRYNWGWDPLIFTVAPTSSHSLVPPHIPYLLAFSQVLPPFVELGSFLQPECSIFWMLVAKLVHTNWAGTHCTSQFESRAWLYATGFLAGFPNLIICCSAISISAQKSRKAQLCLYQKQDLNLESCKVITLAQLSPLRDCKPGGCGVPSQWRRRKWMRAFQGSQMQIWRLAR